MTKQAMIATHTASMNLRFIEREVVVSQDASGVGISIKLRILQQMFVPKDWSTCRDEFWRDVPFIEGEKL